MTRFPILLAAITLALTPISGALGSLDLSALEKLPVQEGGRKKPYLVFAQDSLIGMAGRTAVPIDGTKTDAMQVVTGIWMDAAAWEDQPLILVEHLDVKEKVGFPRDQKWFSHNQLADNTAFVDLVRQAEAAKRESEGERLTGMNKSVEEIALRVAKFEELRRGSLYRVVANPAGSTAPWMTVAPDEPLFANLRTAFLAGDQSQFDTAVAAFTAALAEQAPEFQPSASIIDLETLYQKVHPFRLAWILYLAAGFVLALTSLKAIQPGYLIAWVLVLAGFALQVAGFVARVMIAGRAPVTNMYESILWVAFGVILFALVFELIYKSRAFLLGAIPVAVVSLILADSQPVTLNQSIQPLVPVLQSNFWLTTHVLTITLSYAAFALALGVAHIVLGKVIFGSKPSAALHNYIYRCLQVGVLLLAAGTILGGVWANYSWGRFWDWDPKETWALVALLAYLFILHGRIAGTWSGFGLAVGSILAFQTIIMAWYGVNFVLGVGLHSYGFGTGGIGIAAAFVCVEVAFTALAIIRKRSTKTKSPIAAAVAH